MVLQGTYEPGTWSLAAQQVEEYERTDGAEGGTRQGAPCVILWTRGRRSGNVRKSPLIRVEHEGTYAALASMGGAPEHPSWYLNLVADPNVSLQDGPNLSDYTARDATGEEREAWWARAVDVWPAYDEYQARTDRVIPVVILEPA